MQPSFSETLSCDYFLAKALACIKESNIILKKGVDCTEKDAKKLITYKDNFFTYFDFAVLGGEFYADHKSTLDSIRLQSIDFGKIERLSDTESYPILEKIYQTANYGEILSNSISVYTNLLEYKSIIHPDFLSLDDRIFFFSHKSNTLKSIDDFVHYHTKLNSIDKEDLTWFSLFNINVLLAIQEATLKCEPKNIRNLREIELLLEKEEYKSYSSLRILKEKAQYLSFKTEIRLLKGSISSIDISRIKQNKYYYFKDFYDQTVKFWINKDQTFGESNITEIRSKQHLVLSNDPKPLLSVYHFLNKYFKVKNQRE